MYVLLRHAEKKSGIDPSLTEKGRERAKALARMLGESQDIAIFSTAYNRTNETVTPLAEKTGQPIIEYDRGDIPSLAATLDETSGIRCVVGHSISTMALLQELTGIVDDPIDEGTEFDRMYLFGKPITISNRPLLVRYGEK